MRQRLCLFDGRDGILPAVADLAAGTMLRDIDDIAVLGRDGVVCRFVAAHVDGALLDAVVASDIHGVCSGVDAAVHAG